MTNSSRSWFWPVQIGCWLLIGFLNWLAQYSSGNFSSFNLYINVAGVVAGGLLVTSLYRAYLKKRRSNLKIKAARLIAFLLVSAFVQASVWLLILIIMLLPFKERSSLGAMPIFYNIIPLTGIMLAWDLVYLGYNLLRRYHTSEVEKWQLEAEVRQAQLGTLRSQINPHFLFNSLNNIRALILENPSLARQMLTKFSEIFRYALQYAEGREISVADELNIIEQYLELLKIQYEEKLHYVINANEEALKERIPPMVLQLLVENAVKHGIALQVGGGLIAIDIQRAGSGLTLKVKNTGTLQQKNNLEDSLGIGLNNVKERLRLLYAGKASLSIEEQAPFVLVTICINND
ncbi:sensor histidine kinase [Mucilaginibacter lacusdianchii]|uniref:sensor histidine kinase n=1 Tax=Mucilaginibacter lacusdianchii TaxID=2684211 RepID=UPI00131DF4A8|nr:histidine kinase [Mucilaginibacter sp. JXJ CY 39]